MVDTLISTVVGFLVVLGDLKLEQQEVPGERQERLVGIWMKCFVSSVVRKATTRITVGIEMFLEIEVARSALEGG